MQKILNLQTQSIFIRIKKLSMTISLISSILVIFIEAYHIGALVRR